MSGKRWTLHHWFGLLQTHRTIIIQVNLRLHCPGNPSNLNNSSLHPLRCLWWYPCIFSIPSLGKTSKQNKNKTHSALFTNPWGCVCGPLPHPQADLHFSDTHTCVWARFIVHLLRWIESSLAAASHQQHHNVILHRGFMPHCLSRHHNLRWQMAWQWNLRIACNSVKLSHETHVKHTLLSKNKNIKV